MRKKIDFSNCIRIMKKDWKGTIANKDIYLPMILLPFIFTIVMPILILWSVLYDPEGFVSEFGSKEELMVLLNVPRHYNDYLVAAVISSKILILPYFLFIPAFSSIIIAADSFAGEKERKTIESLALLPISKSELIIGKVLAAFIPAMVISLIFFGIQGVVINLMFLPHLEGNILIFTDVVWLLCIFLLAPALGFFNILVTVIISSRVRSFKNAQSIAGSLITPIILLSFIQIFNPAFLSPIMILILSGILGILSLLLIHLGSKVLDIEKLILML